MDLFDDLSVTKIVTIASLFVISGVFVTIACANKIHNITNPRMMVSYTDCLRSEMTQLHDYMHIDVFRRVPDGFVDGYDSDSFLYV